MDRFDDFDNLPLGTLIGDYFHVVSTIAKMEAELDDEQLEQSWAYEGLIESRERLREQLDEVSRPHHESDIKSAIDEAFRDL